MWDVTSGDFHIFRLDLARQTWVDTGVALDDRPSTRADILWDEASEQLYVASHNFTTSPATGNPSRLYRYRYDPANNTYVHDPDLPITINDYQLETLVIDKDATGRLWATWVEKGKVWISATVCSPHCNDGLWGPPFNVSASDVGSDDISSLIAFGGNRVGVMWSDQNTGTFHFAVHYDTQPDDAWSVETAINGPNMADDHIDLKSDSTGRIFASVKTSRTAPTDPLILLLVRSTEGDWSSHTFGVVEDNHTRPIMQMDEEHGVVHLFATAPSSGGSIYEKTSRLDRISFPSGTGTEILKDAGGKLNEATSTKQNVNSETGLLVVAHSSDRSYFHTYYSLRDSPPSG